VALLGVRKPAHRAQGSPPMTNEQWRPIPGWPGYETDGQDFYSIQRTITRRDGHPYTVHGKKLKISAHRTNGAPVVKLSKGGAGKGRWYFVHLLLAATFGEQSDGAS
jgi:hypothetical protein